MPLSLRAPALARSNFLWHFPGDEESTRKFIRCSKWTRSCTPISLTALSRRVVLECGQSRSLFADGAQTNVKSSHRKIPSMHPCHSKRPPATFKIFSDLAKDVSSFHPRLPSSPSQPSCCSSSTDLQGPRQKAVKPTLVVSLHFGSWT